MIRSRRALPQYAIKIKIGNADASKNNKNTNKLVQLNAPTRQTSKSSIKVQNKIIFILEYHEVIKDSINTNVLKIINGRLRLLLTSNKLTNPILIALGYNSNSCLING